MMDPTTLDDHAFAVWAAERAGTVLLDVRARAADEGLEGKALKDAGDAAAQAELDRVLTQHRPGDSVLSEEAADDKTRLTARRVWIIDPLDGTREFSEPPRDDWAVHVALWEDGELVAGAVAQPALGETFSTGRPSVLPARTSDRPRIAVSRSRPPAFVESLAAELDAELPAKRIHFDLRPREGTRDEEVERVLALGATQVDDQRGTYGPGTGWVVLADPEGNLFCILRSQAEVDAGPPQQES